MIFVVVVVYIFSIASLGAEFKYGSRTGNQVLAFENETTAFMNYSLQCAIVMYTKC